MLTGLELDIAWSHCLAQVVHLLQTQTTLSGVHCEASSSEGVQHGGQAGQVSLPVPTMDDDVIYVCGCLLVVGAQRLVHEALEHGGRPHGP